MRVERGLNTCLDHSECLTSYSCIRCYRAVHSKGIYLVQFYKIIELQKKHKLQPRQLKQSYWFEQVSRHYPQKKSFNLTYLSLATL